MDKTKEQSHNSSSDDEDEEEFYDAIDMSHDTQQNDSATIDEEKRPNVTQEHKQSTTSTSSTSATNSIMPHSVQLSSSSSSSSSLPSTSGNLSQVGKIKSQTQLSHSSEQPAETKSIIPETIPPTSSLASSSSSSISSVSRNTPQVVSSTSTQFFPSTGISNQNSNNSVTSSSSKNNNDNNDNKSSHHGSDNNTNNNVEDNNEIVTQVVISPPSPAENISSHYQGGVSNVSSTNSNISVDSNNSNTNITPSPSLLQQYSGKPLPPVPSTAVSLTKGRAPPPVPPRPRGMSQMFETTLAQSVSSQSVNSPAGTTAQFKPSVQEPLFSHAPFHSSSVSSTSSASSTDSRSSLDHPNSSQMPSIKSSVSAPTTPAPASAVVNAVRSDRSVFSLPSSPQMVNSADQIHFDPRMMLKNLDTGEIVHIDMAASAFPEVAKVMNLSFFDQHPVDHKMDVEPESKESEEETNEKRKIMGFVETIKNVFNRGGGSMKGSSHTPDHFIKVKTKNKHIQQLQDLHVIQDIIHHNGPIWTMGWSGDGNFLATGGQDSVVRVWALINTPAAAETEAKLKQAKTNENPQQIDASTAPVIINIPTELGGRPVVLNTPHRMYSGHKDNVIDLSWGKANFLLTASMDRTVRLWHPSRQKFLRVFQHPDSVTAISFHPTENKYFVSGCFDKRLRIWDITQRCVIEWAQTPTIVTAVTFSPDGKKVVAGLYNGQCVFYYTNALRYITQIDCRNRHGKYRKGKKVTGLQFTPDGKKLLVTTNDSRIRLDDLDDFSCICKFKGLTNDDLQIKAYFSEDAQHVISGSEDQHVFLWDTYGENDEEHKNAKHGKHGQERNEFYQYFKAHSTTVTSAQFVPPSAVKLCTKAEDSDKVKLIVTASFDGELKFFESKTPSSQNHSSTAPSALAPAPSSTTASTIATFAESQQNTSNSNTPVAATTSTATTTTTTTSSSSRPLPPPPPTRDSHHHHTLSNISQFSSSLSSSNLQ